MKACSGTILQKKIIYEVGLRRKNYEKLVSGCIAVSMVLGMMAGSTAMAADDALDNIKERGKLIVDN